MGSLLSFYYALYGFLLDFFHAVFKPSQLGLCICAKFDLQALFLFFCLHFYVLASDQVPELTFSFVCCWVWVFVKYLLKWRVEGLIKLLKCSRYIWTKNTQIETIYRNLAVQGTDKYISTLKIIYYTFLDLVMTCISTIYEFASSCSPTQFVIKLQWQLQHTPFLHIFNFKIAEAYLDWMNVNFFMNLVLKVFLMYKTSQNINHPLIHPSKALYFVKPVKKLKSPSLCFSLSPSLHKDMSFLSTSLIFGKQSDLLFTIDKIRSSFIFLWLWKGYEITKQVIHFTYQLRKAS